MKTNIQAAKPNLVPQGTHPVAGYTQLKSQLGVYRTLLRPVKVKKDPKHADYKGILNIANGQARIFIWVHTDGTLGLRLAKMKPQTGGQSK